MQASNEQESFDTVAIVGLGLMGGSLALALRRFGFGGKLIGVSSPKTIAEAIATGLVDEAFSYDQLVPAVSTADLIVLSSPIATIREHLHALGQAGGELRSGVVVTDVGSTKRAILAAARALPERASFVGGHPLCGSERRGVAAADAFLYQNAYYVLTPSPGVSDVVVARLGNFLGRTGARLVTLAAEDHDQIAAAISHLPQLLAVSLVRFLDNLGANRAHGVHLAAGGFRDMTRIASSPYSVWRDIIGTNRDVLATTLTQFLEATQRTFAGLQDPALQSAFEQAERTRAEIPRDSKGFLSRLWDVLVVVEDRPGMIVEIAAPLANKGINIKDIEVLKVREGEGGTLRLAFATRELAEAAIGELESRGLKARLRD